MLELELELPYPPSVNHYWIHCGRRVVLGPKGRLYRLAVHTLVDKYRRRLLIFPELLGRLKIEIDVYPPDRRRRDLDNLPKAIQDALQTGSGWTGVYRDDCQIDDTHTTRKQVEPGGRVVVRIKELAAG